MNELDGWIDIAKDCKYLPENDLKKLCDIVCDLLMEEPNIRPVSTPVTVCGDIHGQVSHSVSALSVTYLILLLPSHLVLRPGGVVSVRWSSSGHQLRLHGRLCGPWLLQPGDAHPANDSEGALPGPDYAATGKPRVPTDHQGLRVLRRVSEQVRQRERLEVLLPGV